MFLNFNWLGNPAMVAQWSKTLVLQIQVASGCLDPRLKSHLRLQYWLLEIIEKKSHRYSHCRAPHGLRSCWWYRAKKLLLVYLYTMLWLLCFFISTVSMLGLAMKESKRAWAYVVWKAWCYCWSFLYIYNCKNERTE